MPGPLEGVKVLEFAGIGPGPMCAMLLADLGATVLRIDRKEAAGLGIERPLRFNTLLRNRYPVAMDLKSPAAIAAALDLVKQADVLIEGFRPGVMERLGLGPEVCLARNPHLVYGRITGWGQEGPLAASAGHDINYLSLTGLLDAIGRQGQAPSIPLNVLGDFAGGSLYLALGVLAGVLHARAGGRGQVVDAAIVDGAAHLSSTFFGLLAAGLWNEGRGNNLLDSGAPYYECYACRDGKYISVGPIEPKFYAQLVQALGLEAAGLPGQADAQGWPAIRAAFGAAFLARTRDEWAARLEHTDACATGVLGFGEAPGHPHLRARQTYVEVEGVVQPAPAPRFSQTAPGTPFGPRAVTPENTRLALATWLPPDGIDCWMRDGTVG
ncbi:MAG: CaiB/BaiF CoA-transferase family protein [Pseudomonadota bacterium]